MRHRFNLLVRAISGSAILVGWLGSAAVCEAAEWTLTPRLSMTGGGESDLVLDPNLDRSVVPAGGFLDLSPGLRARTRLGVATEFRLETQAVLERYFNSDERLLYAHSLSAEWLHWGGSGLRSRLTGSGSFFDDSERGTVRRFGGGIEGGLGVVRPDWSLELFAGLRGRRYPDLSVADDLGAIGTYVETSYSVGANAALRLGRLLLRPELGYQSTGARDPLFDSSATSLDLRAQLILNQRLRLSANTLAQSRDFSQRLTGEDHDEYLQGGAGLDLDLSSNVGLILRYSFARYTRTTGEDEDTQRFEMGLRYVFDALGAAAAPSDVDVVALRREFVSRSGHEAPEDQRTLRLFAPQARSVSVAGDFNRWSVTSHPLRPEKDGWWEIELDLPAGVYQYRFIVDGAWLPPSDDARAVDDGFGGRNALLEIAEDSR